MTDSERLFEEEEHIADFDFDRLFEEEERNRIDKSNSKKKAQRLAFNQKRRAKRKLTMSGKTQEEILTELFVKNQAKNDEDVQAFMERKKKSQEEKQKGQDKNYKLMEKLMDRQDKLDAKRDADDAEIAAKVAANKKSRDDGLKALAAAFVTLKAGAPVPDPVGTPKALQASTPLSNPLSRSTSKAPSGLHLKTPSSFLSKGHSTLSPVDEKVAESPKKQGTMSAKLELASHLEILTPSVDAPDWKIPGVSLVLYTASKSDIMEGHLSDKPLKTKDALLGIHGSRQVQDCTVVLASGTLGGFPAMKKPGMLARLVGSSLKAVDGVAIDENIDNVDRIFAGDDVLVAFVGDSAHWYRYKGIGTYAFEKQAVICMPHVIDLAVKDGQVAILEERTENTRKGMSLQVRRLTLGSIQELAAQDKAAKNGGTVIIYDANNRVGGKVFLGANGNAFLCLEDRKKNMKLFQVPDKGMIKSRSVSCRVDSLHQFMHLSHRSILLSSEMGFQQFRNRPSHYHGWLRLRVPQGGGSQVFRVQAMVRR